MRKCTKRAVSWLLAIVMLFSMSGVAMAAETELSEEPAVTAEVEAAENPELTDTSEALEGDIGDFDETEAAETGVVEKAEPEDADEAELEEQEALEADEEGAAVETVTVYVWMDGYGEPVPVEMPVDEAPPEALGVDTTSTRRRAPARVSLPSYEEAYAAMMALMSEYPEGMTWTNYEPYGDNGKLGKYYRFQGGTIHGAYAVGVGCAALCFKFHDLAYPGLPIYVYDRGGFDWDDIHVGDFLRVDSGTHSVTVLKKTDNAIIVVEGNYNGGVHWGRVISKADLMREITYMVTSYPKGYTDPSDDVEVKVDHSGTEGSLSWELNSNGVLTITGSGAMPDYDLNDARPGWYDYRDQIYSVEIGEGVTSIGDNAFRGLETAYTNLNSVTISTTVTRVGAYAFYKTGLVGVSIPGSVKTIGDSAFYWCPNLTTLDIGNGVETIGQKAFYGCTALNYVDIPSSVRSLGGVDGAVFSGCTNLFQVRFMPNDNIQIGPNTFTECQRINLISLPEGMTELPPGMFQSCKLIKYIYMPSTLRYITVAGVTDPFMSSNGVSFINFGGTEAQWKALVAAIPTAQHQSKKWMDAVTEAGQVYYNQTDPFVPLPDTDDVMTCVGKGEHLGEKDAEGNCDVCGEPFDRTPGSTVDPPIDPNPPVDPPVDPNPPAKHEHDWAAGWASDENAHWHECLAEGCDIANNAGKDGYAVHAYGDWEVVTEPGIDSAGLRERICECGYKQTEEIPATGYVPGDSHDHDKPAENWSYGSDYHWRACLEPDCEELYDYAAHTWAAIDGVNPEENGWVITTPATASTPGEKTRTCEVCGYTVTEEIPAKHEHDWATGWTSDENAHWHECQVAECYVTVNAEKDGYAAHDYGAWVVDTAATATVAGSQHRDCVVCGDRQTETIPATGGNTGNPSNPGGSGGTNKPSNPGGSGNTSRPNSGGGSSTTTPTNKPTTTVTTDPKTGAKIETTTRPDGSKTVVTTQKDGTAVTVETMVNGAVKTEVRLSAEVIQTARQRGEAVRLPVEAVRVVRNIPDTMPITVRTGSAEEVQVMIPAVSTTPGTVAMLVGTDASTNVVRISVVTAEGVIASLPDGATVVLVDNSKAFTDVSAGNWAADAVAFASARGLLVGTSAMTFSPDAAMTRGMLMTVLARFAGADTAGGETWYEKSVEWAVENGISDGSNPNGNITREQLVVMLWRYYGSPSAAGTLTGFTDVGQVSGYAQEAMAWAVENGIVSGFGDGRIGPKGQATRAQVAQILMNLLNNLDLAR